jgi:F0F1-type ATP synthase assembly protein I
MKCPKCEKTIADKNDDYCSKCATALKQECPECGNLEPIGFPVCQTKLEKARKELRDFVEKKRKEEKEKVAGRIEKFITFLVPNHLFIFTISLILLPVLIVLFLERYFEGSIKFILFFLAIFLPTFYIMRTMNMTAKKVTQAGEKAEEEFFEKFPEYGELLKKERVLRAREKLLARIAMI